MRRYSSRRLRATLFGRRPRTKDAADAHRNRILRPVRL
jgi:hypothetical protein